MKERHRLGTSALVVAHPGHELRVHHFLEREQPRTFVLTDGSGRESPSRLHGTTGIVERAGAKLGGIYGRLTDRALYAALRAHDVALFEALAAELAEELVAHEISSVVSDAVEHVFLAHDVVGALVDTALALARARGWEIAAYDFMIDARPDTCPDALRPRAMRLALDDAAFERKRAAAFRYEELRGELALAIERHGEDAFRIECLRPVDAPFERLRPAETAAWEAHGEKLAAAGVYPQALRYRDDLAPLYAALAHLA